MAGDRIEHLFSVLQSELQVGQGRVAGGSTVEHCSYHCRVRVEDRPVEGRLASLILRGDSNGAILKQQLRHIGMVSVFRQGERRLPAAPPNRHGRGSAAAMG